MEQAAHLVPLNWYLFLSTFLFCIGVMGVLFNLLLVAFSAYSGNSDGQVFVFFIMVVAAAEVAVGLALLISIYRNIGSTDIDVLNKLKW